MTASRLPIIIEKGAEGTPVWKTHRIVAMSGRQQRALMHDYPLHRWDIGYGLRYMSDWHDAFRVFMTYSTIHPFRFRWDHDTRAAAEFLGTGDGVNTDFQLRKAYAAPSPGTRQYYLRIWAPIESTIVVGVNLMVLNASEWTLMWNNSGAFIRLDTAAPNGHNVYWDGEFDRAVIWATDLAKIKVEMSLDELDDSDALGSMRGILLQEVMENPDA